MQIKKGMLVTVACVMAVLLLGSVGVNIAVFARVAAVQTAVDGFVTSGEDVAQEDDVKIGDEYTIRSTRALSDAYLSGDRSKLDDRQKETLAMAEAVVKKVIQADMTDYEKERAIYEWMIDNLQQDSGQLVVIPTTGADCDNPYGVLKNHNAVCVGYATTFRLFMQMLNIECMVVHNTDRYHSWDLVKLDGEWYHTDIYSDMGAKNYANFNMNDAACEKGDHVWNRDFFPAATGTKYNYLIQHKVQLKDIWEIPAAFKKAVNKKQTMLVMGFDSELTATSDLIVQAMGEAINNRLGGCGDDVSLSCEWRLGVNNQPLLQMTVNTSSEQELTEKQQEQVERLVTKIFGEACGDSGDTDESEG